MSFNMDKMTERLFYAFNPHWGNAFPSQEDYVPRDVMDEILGYLGTDQIISLLGPRRTGKTTILKRIIHHLLRNSVEPKNIFYFSFDEQMSTGPEDFEELIQYYFDTIGPNESVATYVLFDEVQHIENWQVILKRNYDLLHPKTKFFVTGSSSLWIKRKSSESLAGRIFEFTVRPLNFVEFLRFDKIDLGKLEPPTSYKDVQRRYLKVRPQESKIVSSFNKYVVFGGFPEIVKEGWDIEHARNYIRTSIVERAVLRDLAQYYPIQNPKELLEILRILAWQSSSLMEINSLSETLNLNRNTVSNYLSYLENAFLLIFSYNYTKSRVKQVRSSKKAFLTDSGIMTTLTHSDMGLFSHPDELGRVIETIVRNHFIIGSQELFHWRDSRKNEVDIIYWDGRTLFPIEVKSTDNIKTKDLAGIRLFMNKYNLERGIVTTRSVFKDLGDIWFIPNWFLLLFDNRLAEKLT